MGVQAVSFCDFDCDDYPEFVSESIRRARKQYRCCDCGGLILPGERYENTAGKWDGDLLTFRTCAACLDGPRRFFSFTCGSWTYGGMVERLYDGLCDADEYVPAPVVRKVKRMVARAEHRRRAAVYADLVMTGAA